MRRLEFALRVAPLVAGVAVILILAAGLFCLAPRPSSSGNPGCGPCGAVITVGTPTENSNGANHWYNFTTRSGGAVSPSKISGSSSRA